MPLESGGEESSYPFGKGTAFLDQRLGLCFYFVAAQCVRGGDIQGKHDHVEPSVTDFVFLRIGR